MAHYLDGSENGEVGKGFEHVLLPSFLFELKGPLYIVIKRAKDHKYAVKLPHLQN